MRAPVIQRKGVFFCGACHSVLVKRSSYLLHPHLRNDVYVCQNPLCSASYSGRTEITGLVSPSGIPHAPACDLPPTPALERAMAERALREQHNRDQLDMFDTPLISAD